MYTNKELLKIRYQKKRRRNRTKRVIYAISVTGMLSLSIYLCLSQGGSSRVGAKAANSHRIETSVDPGENNQELEDIASNNPHEIDSELNETGENKNPLDMNNEGNQEVESDGDDSETTKWGIEEKNEDLENNKTETNAGESNTGNADGSSKDDLNNENAKKDENSKKDTSEDETSKNMNSEIEDEFFKDTIFIGDSRTEGLGQFGGIKNAKFYTYQGLMVNTAIGKDYITLDNKQKGNIFDAAKQTSFSKAYLLFGINELGWNSLDIFIEDYRDIIKGLKKIEPDCEIIIQANYPVSKKMNEGDKVYNNTNIRKFNNLIKKMAEEEGVSYLDLYSYFANKEGNLPDDAATDGIHLTPKYNKDWKQCLINFGSGNTER
ncbi:GDSL-type esterase/lipase family protein [Lachnoclostridium sp.]|uniref:GDSL-type esterase/lipase family protein n=1 Tax=Lachnoclostridium sp. TaxID=2028282 RepID=UPI0028988EBF|nr:GDSL-type esterase/lipase family protein [Lachnoclostridium sp.]